MRRQVGNHIMIISKADFGKYCVIKCRLDGDTFDKLSSLPGYKKWIGRDLLFDPTGANIDKLRNKISSIKEEATKLRALLRSLALQKEEGCLNLEY